jgi:serine/threonine protein kinase
LVFVFGIESDSQGELKIVQTYLDGCSFLKVVSVNLPGWTSTIKTKAVAGIVLGLRFARSLGLVHGHLIGNNILFDSDHCIQIVDFHSIVLEFSESEGEETTQLGGFSGQGPEPEKNIEGFASVLSELVLGGAPPGEVFIPTGIPDFVSKLIKSGRSPILRTILFWRF